MLRSLIPPSLLLAVLIAGSTGCRGHHAAQVRDPHYYQLARDMCRAEIQPLPPVDTVAPIVDALAGPHPVEQYIEVALVQNPNIRAARSRVQAEAERVPQAASLEDPEFSAMGWPFFPNVPQTASGRMTADLNVSQEFPWFGKLRTQAEAAEAETNKARAELRVVELEIIEQVRRRYYELYYLQNAIVVAEESRVAAQRIVELADVKYRAGTVSQQDVLRSQVEVLEVDRELITLRQELVGAQAQLARLLHISPDTPLRAFSRLPPQEVPNDLERLYAQAVAARPELHAQLAAIQRDRRMVEYARLQYYPDVTLLAGWGDMTTTGALAPFADGTDNVNTGLVATLPIYRKRLDAGVRQAEAEAVASARQYDALRDNTLEEVKDLFVEAEAEKELVELLERSIIPKANQTLEVSAQAYRTGETDVLQLIANWQEVLRYRTAYYRQESRLRQTLAMLDRVVGGAAPWEPPIEAVPPGPAVPPEGPQSLTAPADEPLPLPPTNPEP